MPHCLKILHLGIVIEQIENHRFQYLLLYSWVAGLLIVDAGLLCCRGPDKQVVVLYIVEACHMVEALLALALQSLQLWTQSAVPYLKLVYSCCEPVVCPCYQASLSTFS